MDKRTYCDKCGIQLHDGPESNPITVNVNGLVYYEGHLCTEHWKELMVVLEQYLQISEENETKNRGEP